MPRTNRVIPLLSSFIAAMLTAVPSLAQQPAGLASSPQQQQERVFYFPKPIQRTAYQPPMKPVTRLADLKAKHAGQASWRELVIADNNSRAYMIQQPPGSRYERRLYADSPAWWAVLEGRIDFEIERPNGTFEKIAARKGSYVFAPERLLHSLEVVGDKPAIRFEVTLAGATPVFEQRPAPASGRSSEYIPIRLSAGPNPLDVPDLDGKPWSHHVNIYDLAKENEGKPRWSQPAMRKNPRSRQFHLRPGQRRAHSRTRLSRPFPLGLRGVLGDHAGRAAMDLRRRFRPSGDSQARRHCLRAAQDLPHSAVPGSGGSQLPPDQQHFPQRESPVRCAALTRGERMRTVAERGCAWSDARRYRGAKWRKLLAWLAVSATRVGSFREWLT